MNESKKKTGMTIDQFNEKYTISVLTQATMDAELSTDLDELNYGSIDDVLGNINYAVYDKETKEEELLVDNDNDTAFIDELIEKFNIIGL